MDDQSDGSIKIFPLIDYEIAGNSQQQVTVLLPFFSNISALQAVGLFRFYLYFDLRWLSLWISALIHELLGLFLLYWICITVDVKH